MQLRQAVGLRRAESDPRHMLTSHAESDPRGEQKVRAAISDAIHRAAELMAPQPHFTPDARTELYETAWPKNQINDTVRRELEAIFRMRPVQVGEPGRALSGDRRHVDVFTAPIPDFPGFELRYDYIRSTLDSSPQAFQVGNSREPLQPARLRISLQRVAQPQAEANPPILLSAYRAARQKLVGFRRRGRDNEEPGRRNAA